MGIYRIKYIANKNLVDAILPRREDGCLKWDLKDGEGIYNSVDIDSALKFGYHVEILEGYYWENVNMVFGDYVDFLYQFKKNSSKGSAEYTLAKLMMNGIVISRIPTNSTVPNQLQSVAAIERSNQTLDKAIER